MESFELLLQLNRRGLTLSRLRTDGESLLLSHQRASSKISQTMRRMHCDGRLRCLMACPNNEIASAELPKDVNLHTRYGL
jgi:hypothetical protein